MENIDWSVRNDSDPASRRQFERARVALLTSEALLDSMFDTATSLQYLADQLGDEPDRMRCLINESGEMSLNDLTSIAHVLGKRIVVCLEDMEPLAG